MLPVDIAVDAEDLYQCLVKPALGSQTDQGMAIYISSLRHDSRTGRIRAKYWVPTAYMLSNYGTKLDREGELPLGDIITTMVSGLLKLDADYKYNGQRMKAL